ncbi:MAG: flagellar assembly protein FliH [Myxococcales bacterium]|nr:flagellar assembly protein FliH [Myxococcales bacterium]
MDISHNEPQEELPNVNMLAAKAQSEFEAKLQVKVAEAERRGQERGFQEAARVDAEERKKLLDKMKGAFSALNTALDKTEASCTRDSMRLGLRVAQRIARVALSTNIDAIIANIQEGLGKMPNGGEVKVVASPELAKKLTADTDSILRELGIQDWLVEADEGLQPGDLVLYRGSSAMDGRISSRLEILEEALMKELGISIVLEDTE